MANSKAGSCTFLVSVPTSQSDGRFRLVVRELQRFWPSTFYSLWFSLPLAIPKATVGDSVSPGKQAETAAPNRFLILGWILEDGFGDAVYAKNLYEFLHSYLKNVHIDIMLVDGHKGGEGRIFVHSNFNTVPGTKITIYDYHFPEKAEFMKISEEYDLLLAGPYKIAEYLQLMKEPAIAEKVIQLDELAVTDFIQSQTGIIFPQDFASDLVSHVFSNRRLQELFANDQKPFFCYMKSRLDRLFHAIMKLYDFKEYHVLVLSAKGLAAVMAFQNKDFKPKMDLKPFPGITIMHENGPKQGTIETFGNPEPERKLIIHYFESVSQKDFRKALLESQLIVGVTGDQSFLEAIRYAKVPIRDDIKTRLIKGWRFAVLDGIGEESPLYGTTRYSYDSNANFLSNTGPHDLETLRNDVKRMYKYLWVYQSADCLLMKLIRAKVKVVFK